MTGHPPQVIAHHHVLAAPDVEAAARSWIGTMGFEPWMAPAGWRFVRRGGCALMLGECPDANPVPDLGDHRYFAYFEMVDVDACHAEIRDRCEGVSQPPTGRPWSMREMIVATPDGHRMVFAQDLGKR